MDQEESWEQPNPMRHWKLRCCCLCCQMVGLSWAPEQPLRPLRHRPCPAPSSAFSFPSIVSSGLARDWMTGLNQQSGDPTTTQKNYEFSLRNGSVRLGWASRKAQIIEIHYYLHPLELETPPSSHSFFPFLVLTRQIYFKRVTKRTLWSNA